MTQPPICDECGFAKEYVDEPLISGFKGYICTVPFCKTDK